MFCLHIMEIQIVLLFKLRNGRIFATICKQILRCTFSLFTRCTQSIVSRKLHQPKLQETLMSLKTYAGSQRFCYKEHTWKQCIRCRTIVQSRFVALSRLLERPTWHLTSVKCNFKREYFLINSTIKLSCNQDSLYFKDY